MERTLIIVKPDGVQRGLIGDIISRFEKKGLKIAGMKMIELHDALVREHYSHHTDKPFFKDLAAYMQESPVVVVALEGLKAVEIARAIAGVKITDLGSVRGDYVISFGKNIIHSSDSVDAAQKEIPRFFLADELFDYEKDVWKRVYSQEDRPR